MQKKDYIFTGNNNPYEMLKKIDERDILHRTSFINFLVSICNKLSNKGKGCCFAIDGAWGSGKSFMLEMLEKKLSTIQSEETADDKFLVFHYDCWKYDYYEEPLIAIVAAMLDTIKEEQRLLPESVGNAAKLSLRTAVAVLETMAKEYYKNKIGIDLVEVAHTVLEEHDESKVDYFDTLYAFKQALEETRKGMEKIASDKTMIIVVDELDRCLPEYAIKVLERLHHVFVDIDNVIVIISMDKSQLEHSVKKIYGNINVDNYLKKFILFTVPMTKGRLSICAERFPTYFALFDFEEDERLEIERFFSNILINMDIRKIEYIFQKAELLHELTGYCEIRDGSVMICEILYMTLIERFKEKELEWIFVSAFEKNIDNITKKYISNSDLENVYMCIKKYIDNEIYITNEKLYHCKDTLFGRALYLLLICISQYKELEFNFILEGGDTESGMFVLPQFLCYLIDMEIH
mgnify:CR=1 FL=1